MQTVQNCEACAKNATPRRQPLIVSELPEYPWQVVGTDLFEIKGVHYLLTVDYFSRYPEVLQLTSTTATTVIAALKSVFARHGIPEVVRSDNGPQFSAHEFARFASRYEFQHVTSSPRFPQSNGQVERMVQTVKRMLVRSGDHHLALLSYRAMPLPWCDLSPAELCMGRRVRTPVPQTDKQLVPAWPYLMTFKEKNKSFKEAQKKNYDRSHRAKEQSPITDNSEVWITSESEHIKGRVVSSAEHPRSYVVETPTGEIRRNRSHINVVPEQAETEQPEAEAPQASRSAEPPPNTIMTRSRSGAQIRPPDRLA